MHPALLDQPCVLCRVRLLRHPSSSFWSRTGPPTLLGPAAVGPHSSTGLLFIRGYSTLNSFHTGNEEATAGLQKFIASPHYT